MNRGALDEKKTRKELIDGAVYIIGKQIIRKEFDFMMKESVLELVRKKCELKEAAGKCI